VHFPQLLQKNLNLREVKCVNLDAYCMMKLLWIFVVKFYSVTDNLLILLILPHCFRRSLDTVWYCWFSSTQL